MAQSLRRIGERALAWDGHSNLSLPVPDGARERTLQSVSATDMRTMVSEGLVAFADGVVRRTAEGRAYLKRSLTRVPPDDAYAAQHREMTVREIASKVGVAVNAAESPLAWLATRRDRGGRPMLSREQVEAGRRLAVDHERGLQRERVTQSWDASGVRGDGPRDRLSVSEAANDARRRVERALSSVGADLAPVLVAVCCEEKGLEMVEKANGWPPRCGKVVLRLALDRLATHYGLAPFAQGEAGPGLLRWGAPDYRPNA